MKSRRVKTFPFVLLGHIVIVQVRDLKKSEISGKLRGRNYRQKEDKQ